MKASSLISQKYPTSASIYSVYGSRYPDYQIAVHDWAHLAALNIPDFPAKSYLLVRAQCIEFKAPVLKYCVACPRTACAAYSSYHQGRSFLSYSSLATWLSSSGSLSFFPAELSTRSEASHLEKKCLPRAPVSLRSKALFQFYFSAPASPRMAVNLRCLYTPAALLSWTGLVQYLVWTQKAFIQKLGHSLQIDHPLTSQSQTVSSACTLLYRCYCSEKNSWSGVRLKYYLE